MAEGWSKRSPRSETGEAGLPSEPSKEKPLPDAGASLLTPLLEGAHPSRELMHLVLENVEVLLADLDALHGHEESLLALKEISLHGSESDRHLLAHDRKALAHLIPDGRKLPLGHLSE